MTLRVHLRPRPGIEHITRNTGIGRVLFAQREHLPAHDIEFVDDLEAADVSAGHVVIDPKGEAEIPAFDVQHSHGLWWNGDRGMGKYGEGHAQLNARIVNEYRKARVITVPSAWVAECFKRDMHVSPVVIGHGIDLHEWQPGENQGYVLWNKSRVGDVCDPTPAYELAMRGVKVVSTYGPPDVVTPDHMRITGILTHPEMVKAVAGADVYLATTKETFGIGTIEAMAAGVPILGYDWGGTSDIIEHKRTGFLVQPGDIDGLMAGLGYIRSHRAEMGAEARTAAAAYDWPNIIGQYADLYKRVADEKAGDQQGVSVIITCFNYGRWAGEAIDSVLAQTQEVEEIIVVDDGSTDDSLSIIRDHLATLRGAGARVRLVDKPNGGVASARNLGASLARQPFLCFLDADDRLDPRFVASLLPRLQADRSLGIAYSGLGLLSLEGERITPAAWPPPFTWEQQSAGGIPPGNCIPSACLFRREMWVRAGGVKQDYAPGEDAEFWTRGLSLGYYAEQVTREPLFQYRAHEGGAHRVRQYVPVDPWHPWIRDRQMPMAVPTAKGAMVRSYSAPVVSVLLFQPDTEMNRVNTLDRLKGQTFREWECLTYGISEQAAYPWVRLCNSMDDALARARADTVLAIGPDFQWTGDSVARLLKAYSTNLTILAGNGMALLPTEHARAMGARGLEALMGCGCNASKANEIKAAMGWQPDQQTTTVNGLAVKPTDKALMDAMSRPVLPDLVRVEYTGANAGKVTYTVNGKEFIGAREGKHRFQDVPRQYLNGLLGTGRWRVVAGGDGQQASQNGQRAREAVPA